eukprot:TRINITY_DN16973_c0_g1_i1.p1 TRINITY_DN16973_c0_g1~~TRINITY_DN16973_c0_g1_i1.p1  ORF type:complete len:188 (-),score=36.51 TRINITY_DN16973_c0_g1_i1:18-581(-)
MVVRLWQRDAEYLLRTSSEGVTQALSHDATPFTSPIGMSGVHYTATYEEGGEALGKHIIHTGCMYAKTAEAYRAELDRALRDVQEIADQLHAHGVVDEPLGSLDLSMFRYSVSDRGVTAATGTADDAAGDDENDDDGDGDPAGAFHWIKLVELVHCVHSSSSNLLGRMGVSVVAKSVCKCAEAVLFF